MSIVKLKELATPESGALQLALGGAHCMSYDKYYTTTGSFTRGNNGSIPYKFGDLGPEDTYSIIDSAILGGSQSLNGTAVTLTFINQTGGSAVVLRAGMYIQIETESGSGVFGPEVIKIKSDDDKGTGFGGADVDVFRGALDTTRISYNSGAGTRRIRQVFRVDTNIDYVSSILIFGPGTNAESQFNSLKYDTGQTTGSLTLGHGDHLSGRFVEIKEVI